MATKQPSLKQLAAMDSEKWYDVRATYSGLSGSMITARKHGARGRYFLAWTKEDLMRDVHGEEE
jgi:hypothetical protein